MSTTAADIHGSSETWRSRGDVFPQKEVFIILHEGLVRLVGTVGLVSGLGSV